MMRKRLCFGLVPVFISIVGLVGFERTALCAPISFETDEGYSAMNLHGQPAVGNQWSGDVTDKIVVTETPDQAGEQSVLLDPDQAAGRVNNELDVGPAPTRFSLKFRWRPSGAAGGDAVVYLSQLSGSPTNFVGPFVQFAGESTVYQIKYVENGFVGNIKLGMTRGVYENNWWDVEIVGDLSTRTFDFYLDGTLEASGLGFRNTQSNLATSLSFLGLQASTSGAADHYFDDFEISEGPPEVPTLSEWGLMVLLGLVVGSGVWMKRGLGRRNSVIDGV